HIYKSFRLIKIKLPQIKLPSSVPLKFKVNLNFFESLSLKLKYLVLGSLITLSSIFFYQSYIFVKNLPSPQNIGKINYALSTHIFDRNGKLLYEIYRDQNRTPIRIQDVPLYVTQATIAIEDKEFYRHNGISIVGGIFRALKETLIKGDLQGGSTITQQLVKSSLLTPDRTFERKIKEIILALWTERLFSKDQILEMYLNQVPYGGSSYGIEEASKTYFGKQAKELTLAEAALLAGLPQAPTLYSPYTNPALAIARRNEVLSLMRQLKFISQDEELKAQLAGLNVNPLATRISAPHFVFYVKSQLENIYGIKQVEEGGLKVTTTLDLGLQLEAEKILKEEIEKIKPLNVSNGAILVTRPQTGEILAMVGSVDYFASPSGSFNVTTALRQPGSSIKPIMYSTALERNYTAATIIDDSAITFHIPGSQPYSPVNYDGRFHGRIPVRLALASSFNVPAVKVLNTIGVDSFIRQAQKMGVTTWDDTSRFGLSLTLGGGEVKMIDMATAYGSLANLGYKVSPNYIVQLENTHGDKIGELSPSRTKVVNEGIAFILSDILSDNFARQLAFGQRSLLEIPGYKVAVKTGTTDQKKDNWTIGYTPEFLVVVWVGNNDNTPMNGSLTSGITGAAPIWNRMITHILKTYGNGSAWYSKPENVVEKICYFGRTEYFLSGTENTTLCKDLLFKPTPSSTP
ncbi:PBP1A family penicillin-binding protein, partial [Candidatus Roizmanbacteria bacterium]|nr:PBP1A family penicillin-binding protein [Candidatus Roizmanbacteria bacterium]